MRAVEIHQYGGRGLGWQEQSWPGVRVGYGRWQVTEDCTGLSQRSEHQLFVTFSGSIRRTTAWLEDGERYDGAEFPEATTFIPSERQRRSIYRDGAIEYALVRLDPTVLTSYDGVVADRLEFTGFTNRPDHVVNRLARALCDEARDPGFGGRLFVESVTTTLGLHLLRSYSNLRPQRLTQPQAGLAGPVLRRVLDYIEEHLGDDLRLTVLAGLAGTDQARFGRAFKASVGLSPHRYVTRRRLERAAHLLRAQSALSIAEIAHHVGLSSQSHLTSAFGRSYGVTPRAYRAAAQS